MISEACLCPFKAGNWAKKLKLNGNGIGHITGRPPLAAVYRGLKRILEN